MSAVVVAGALANKAGSGGEAWVRLSWIRGFERLGLDVRFVEELSEPLAADPARLRWFEAVTERFGLQDRATLLVAGHAVAGPSLSDVEAFAAKAMLVNISGHLTIRPLFDRFERRVMVDIDPGFTQFWHDAGLPGARVAGHDLHFTIGELIGTPECPIPTGGIEWRHVRPPVLLDDWPVVATGEPGHFTTIASWRGPFGPIEHGGQTFGLKVHEFRRFITLPRGSPHRFEIALAIDPADEADLAALGEQEWHVVDPGTVAGDPDAFRRYIQGSGAEFSVAQGLYVDTRCGWFSDRTTRYLATGKPALVQDTGFSRTLPTGDGLVAFRTLDEAVQGAADIVERYDEHAATARRIAEEHFAAERVLARFCEESGMA
jgi:hypothetical protein